MVTFVNGSFVWADPDAPGPAALDFLARAPACCRRHAAAADVLGTLVRVTSNLPWRAPACCRRHAAAAGILGTLAHQKGSAMRVAVTLQTS